MAKPNVAKLLRTIRNALLGKHPAPAPAPQPVPEPVPVPVPVPVTPAFVDNRPAPGTPLRGQFVVTILGAPYGPTEGGIKNPRSIFFMDEIDTVYKEYGEAEARRIVREYKAMGANHITAGPIFAAGYGGDYPTTDWRNDPQGYLKVLQMLAEEGLEITFFAFTDNAPYYHPDTKTFDWVAIRRDFVPVFKVIAPLIRRVSYMWEDYQRTDVMAEGWDILHECFPDALRLWHNSTNPPHLSPAMGDQGEEYGWQVAKAHGCGGLGHQSQAFDRVEDITVIDARTFDMRDRQRTKMEQNVYDLLDIKRRFYNGYAGWPTGLTQEWMEGCAWGVYRARLSPETGRIWYRTISTVPNVVHILDALPNAR